METKKEKYEKELDKLCDEFGFNQQISLAFKQLMLQRFEGQDTRYAREWAVRFDCESAYAHSDNQTRKFLAKYGLSFETSPSGTIDDKWIPINEEKLKMMEADETKYKTYKVLIEISAYNEEDMREQVEQANNPEIEWWCCCDE